MHEVLTPTLLATHGAVVSEFLSARNISTVLVYDDESVFYDFWAGRHSVYDLKSDPEERRGRGRRHLLGDATLLDIMRAYRDEGRRFSNFDLIDE